MSKKKDAMQKCKMEQHGKRVTGTRAAKTEDIKSSAELGIFRQICLEIYKEEHCKRLFTSPSPITSLGPYLKQDSALFHLLTRVIS